MGLPVRDTMRCGLRRCRYNDSATSNHHQQPTRIKNHRLYGFYNYKCLGDAVVGQNIHTVQPHAEASGGCYATVDIEKQGRFCVDGK